MSMDITDLPALIAAFGDKEKQDQINFIIKCANERKITFAQADAEIEKIIRAKGDEWKQ